jgi:glycosyltransferase involved in cell wall biosynthesis
MKSAPLKILQIHPFLRGDGLNPRAGGKSRLSLQLSRALALNGQTVAIFPFPEPILEKTYPIENGAFPLSLLPTAKIPPLKKIGSYFWTASRLALADRSGHAARMGAMYLAGLEDAVKEFRPDIIHSQDSFSDFPLFFHALGLRIPLLLTHHTNIAGKHLESYRRLIFTSEAMRTLVCGGSGPLFERARLIRPAVSALFSDPAISVTGRRKGILFVGGLRVDKGLQNLLEAYAHSSALRKVPLRICGIGPEQERFTQFARSHRIPAMFLGRVSPEGLRNELLAAELLVNPSPGEAFSLALVEAMCCGTAALGWKPQMEETEQLLRMECGIGFDPAGSPPDALAEIILAWLGRRDVSSVRYRERLAASARKFFSMERYTAENLAAYREVLEEG